MRILLTNDDGIRAPGIIALHKALVGGDEAFDGPLMERTGEAVTRAPRSVVFPVAPLTVQSATSHGVTFHQPLMLEEVQASEEMRGVAVDGRPADCVKLAIKCIWPERFGEGSRPELLVSGMNAGANCGINVIYSGTVAAALEAAFLGVPSIAVSLMLRGGRPRFDVAARHARHAIEAVIKEGLPRPHECININIPPTHEDGPTPPIRVCPMNTHGLVDAYERRTNPSGDVYYWAAGDGLDFHDVESGSDVEYLREKCITVTPLTYDLTHREGLERWQSRMG